MAEQVPQVLARLPELLKRALPIIFDELLDDFDLSFVTTSSVSLHKSISCSNFALSTAVFPRDRSLRDAVRIENFVEQIVPMYSDVEFHSHFRMQRSTYEELLHFLAPNLPERGLGVDKKVLSVLWLLANEESFRGVADRFDMSKGSLHYALLSVSGTLSSNVGNFIKWPSREELPVIAKELAERRGFPGAVGVIDGTHIEIPGTKENRSSFINRKGFPSIQLQAVCDHQLKFGDIYVGWPGSVHDARVFRNSPLRTKLQEELPPKYHLIGDTAYGLSEYLMVGFRDNGHLTHLQRNFNRCLSSTRANIEMAFGLLKAKWRRLRYLDMRLLEDIPSIISATCVLHNFLLEKESFDPTEAEQFVLADVGIRNVPEPSTDHIDPPVAADKRIEISNLLL